MRILLVEDEVQLAKSLKKILEHSKYNVDLVHDGLESLDYIQTYQYDLILLDVMLPSLDGINILKKIRENNLDVKIIMLTAKNLLDDKVNALDLGADDYITKPFASSELLARIRTQLRRKDVILNNYVFSDLTLELDTYTIKNNNGEFILGKKEFLIMKLLIENKNKIISQDILFEKIWNCDGDASDTVLWTYISYLRKKLRLLNSNATIKVSRGLGYILEVIEC
ncbi:MAG: response regulator transcription factor [bacterium]